MKWTRYILIATLVTLSGCGEDDSSQQNLPEFQSEEPVSATLVEVIEIDFVTPIIATGTIAAKQTSNIGPLVEGVIDEIPVRVGDRVLKGEPLFRTRKADYARRVRETEAAVNVAQARMDQAQNGANRAEELAQQMHVSEARLEIARTDFRIAQATVNQVTAAHETATQSSQDTTVVAPFDGTVTARYADVGVYMTNRFSMGGQSAVIELQEADIVAGIMHAPETALPHLRLGLRTEIFIPGYDEPIESEILIINDKVDVSTRSIDFRLTILNPDYRIKPGQFVRANVYPDPISMLILPRSDIRGDRSAPYVLMALNGVATKVDIKIDELDADRVRIIEGVTVGDLIVDDVAPGVLDGTRIERADDNVAR